MKEYIGLTVLKYLIMLLASNFVNTVLKEVFILKT